MATNRKTLCNHTLCRVCSVQSYFKAVRSTKMKLHSTRAYVDQTPVPKMPAGLVELMEGLSREVLKKNPNEVYEFCAQHMRNLIVLRDGKPPEKYLTLEQKIVKANNIIKQRAEERRRNFDNDMQSHQMQDNVEKQLIDNIAHNVIETVNLTKPEDDSQWREQNEKISEHDINSEDNNVDSGMNVKDYENECTAENLIEKDNGDKGINANNIIKDNGIPNNSVSDVSKDRCLVDSSHTVERGKDTGENLDECFEIDQIDISKKEYELVEQAVTEDKINSTIFPNVEESWNDSSIVQEIGNIDEINNTIISDVEIFQISKGEKKDFKEINDHQDTSKTEGDKNNVGDENVINYNNSGHNIEENLLTTKNLKDVVSSIEIDNDENKDIKLREKLIGIDLENSSKDNENNGIINVIKTDVITTKPEIEVNAIILEENLEINKETVEGTSHIMPNQTKNTETVMEDSQENNLRHKEENEITLNVSVEDAVTENENKYKIKQGLEAKNELPQNKIIVKVLDSDSDHVENVILISEQQNHEMNNCSTNVTSKNNDNTNETSDMNNIIKDQNKSESLLVTIRSEQLDQDNKTDAISGEYNSQAILKEYVESVSENNAKSKKVEGKKEDEEKNDQQDTSKIEGDQNNIFDTHNKNELNYNIIGHNINEQENEETTAFKSPKAMDLETAAITIQKVFRNFLFRSKTSSFEEATNINFNAFERDTDTKGESDLKAHNHNKDRRVMGIGRMDTVLQTVNEEKSLSLSTDDSSTISSAATVIQAHIRGFLCRNRLNRNKAKSSTSLNESNDSSLVSSEVDPDLVKNKTILNIHIVPEGGEFVSRDESLLTSLELSLDGSPPTSANLHPLGYDKSERRKQLKREDAIQSISPPSNNSRLSEEQDSVKEVLTNDVQIDKAEEIDSEMSVASDIKTAFSNDSIPKNSLEEKLASNEKLKDSIRLTEEQEEVIRNDKIEVEHNMTVMVAADSQVTIATSNDDVSKNCLEKKKSEENSKVNSRHQETVKEALINEDKTVKKETCTDISIDIPEHSPKNIPTSNDDIIPKTSGKNIKVKNSLSEKQESVKKVFNGKKETQQEIGSEQTIDCQLNIATPKDDIKRNNVQGKAETEVSSDELDVVTPFTPTEEKFNDSEKPKLLHSGEFHDVVLPTKVSRNDTSVVSDFQNVLVYFLVWKN